ncbi:MAG: DNA-3-methyladenine glycosylase 2 family protein [Pseudomonadota bacterium]
MDKAMLERAISEVAVYDSHVHSALTIVGMPEPRQAAPGFASLVRILVGQQLSIKAAASIHTKFVHALDGDVQPKTVLSASQDELRAAGLSYAKTRYIKALASMIEDGALDLDAIPALGEEQATGALTQVTGIGPWTAQIYLLFCEGRADIWPAGDLALQEALRRLKARDVRPKPAETINLVEPWRPWRGAMAIFLWHYYAASGAPV